MLPPQMDCIALDGRGGYMLQLQQASLRSGQEGSMPEDNTGDLVTQHYASPDLISKILAGLKAAGKDIDNVTLDASAPVPEPASMTALGLGALALLRRRARKS